MGGNLKETLWNNYLDISRPFGHELVLYTLLVLENADDYPWNIYYKKHSNITKIENIESHYVNT